MTLYNKYVIIVTKFNVFNSNIPVSDKAIDLLNEAVNVTSLKVKLFFYPYTTM